MAGFTTYLLTALAGVAAVLGLYIYFFGIPPEMKRQMEEQALKTMGENKASYILKGMISLDRRGDRQTDSRQTRSARSRRQTKRMLRS